MKFAHLADCHIGAWRDPRLRDINAKAFIAAVDTCIWENVDFILISGDLFNTSLPAIDGLKAVVSRLKLLRQHNIPVYMVAGSHDFSPSGKTMLDVLEEAELIQNVVKGTVDEGKLKLEFSVDKKTGAKITGMVGKRGMLEKSYYENIDAKSLEQEPGFKIFMFHTALTELKPKGLDKMDSSPVSMLPRGFDYYAGGHVHIVRDESLPGYKNVVYPGPLFPNSFRELEELKCGGFYIYDDGKLKYRPLQVVNVISIDINCDQKTPEQIESELQKEIEKKEFVNTIVTIRLEGTLKSGKISEINLKDIFTSLYEKSAFFVMHSTSGLGTKEFEEIKVSHNSVEDVEDKLIKEHIGQGKLGLGEKEEIELVKELIKAMNIEKQEGEKSADYEARIKKDATATLNLKEDFS